jgi:hypothetical protein
MHPCSRPLRAADAAPLAAAPWMRSGTAEPRAGDVMLAMRRVFAAAAAERRAMGARARRFVVDELAPARVVDRMAARLEALVDRGSGEE